MSKSIHRPFTYLGTLINIGDVDLNLDESSENHVCLCILTSDIFHPMMRWVTWCSNQFIHTTEGLMYCCGPRGFQHPSHLDTLSSLLTLRQAFYPRYRISSWRLLSPTLVLSRVTNNTLLQHSHVHIDTSEIYMKCIDMQIQQDYMKG